jgi:hypothetical protein
MSFNNCAGEAEQNMKIEFFQHVSTLAKQEQKRYEFRMGNSLRGLSPGMAASRFRNG